MAFVPVLSFVLLLLLGSVDSWAVDACVSFQAPGQVVCYPGDAGCSCKGGMFAYDKYWSDCKWSLGTYGYRCTCVFRCDNKCSADSISCGLSGNIWRPDKCECVDVTDTIYNCINWSTGNIYSSGSDLAIIQACVGGECKRTTTLNGSCQDWGFCPDGVQSCEISKDSLGRKPCRRSGAETTSGSVCYYQCANGRNLRCKPTSTQYVAGAIYVGTCPERPPVSCDPPPPSSSSVSPLSSSSAGGGGSSSSGAGGSSSSCIGDACGDGSSSSSLPPPPGSSGSYIDYMPILEAIRDTLHVANEQRKVLVDYSVEALPAIEGVEDNTYNTWRESYKIRNELTKFSERSLPMSEHMSKSVDSATTLLTDIRDYLRYDTTLQDGHDTSYNPFLRDIVAALQHIDTTVVSIDTSGRDSSFVGLRDSAFVRWWSDYSQDSAAQKGVLGKIWDDIKADRDSVLSRNCTGFNECLAVYKKIDYCSHAWGVSTVNCVDGGSPFDNVLNVEGSILSTIWEAVWGDDSTAVDTSSKLDTNYTFSPQKDTAQSWISRSFNALFSPESTQSILRKVEAMKDSVERTKRDSVKIQPDSLWLDSSQAAAYAENMLLPPGTVNECWVCHADLGTLGGLAPNGLSIHIDFSDFGGFDFCAIIRAIVKIAAFVVCMSLTLGSWMAAFGYNPKNDA